MRDERGAGDFDRRRRGESDGPLVTCDRLASVDDRPPLASRGTVG